MDMVIDARGLNHFQLNSILKEKTADKTVEKICIKRVNGQRYIGAGLESRTPIIIEGLPGNDLASFAQHIKVTVWDNAQDGAGNTMNDGEIIIHGHGGDILAHSMRGGRILVKKGVGTRVGIHMKATPVHRPRVVIGGGCGDFLGEYMAGGIILILRLSNEYLGRHIGTGMHGGQIFIRGEVDSTALSRGLHRQRVTPQSHEILLEEMERFHETFGLKENTMKKQPFTLITPETSRPYQNLYA